MPLVHISLRNVYTPAEKQAIHTAIHEALVECFKIPEHDYHHRMQVFEEYDYPVAPGKSIRSLLIEMLIFPGRSDQAKENLYASICKRLEVLGTAAADVQIILLENPMENWGFRGMSAAKMDLGFNLRV
jgi:phenylpyruvate tautomerase PptA (4-oxalocrotonate tautomerase family)